VTPAVIYAKTNIYIRFDGENHGRCFLIEIHTNFHRRINKAGRDFEIININRKQTIEIICRQVCLMGTFT